MKVLLAFLFVGAVLAALNPKQLAGPPSEFSTHAIPSTQTGALQSRSSFYEVKFQDENPSALMAGVSWSTTIFVETPSTFAFGFFSPEASQFKLTLKDGDGNEVDIDSHAQQTTYPIFSYQFVPTTLYTFDDDTLSVGAYTLQVSSVSKLSQVARKKLVTAGADLIVFNESPIYIHSYLSSYETDVGKPVGLITQVSSSARTELGVIPKALTGVVMSAQMAIDLPDGNEIDVQMHDDGLHNDGAANDGIYGAQIIAQEVGMYRARAIVTGTTASGVQFSRSTEHMLNVIDNEVTFAGTAFGEMKDPERMTIYVAVNVPASNTASEFRGYAEVWGKDASGNDVAVCWISSITNVVELAGENVVPLEFNLKWATLANAVAPFTLKNAYLIDPSAEVPVDLAQSILVKTTQDINAILRMPHIRSVTEPTFEMKKGVMPQKFKNRINATEVGTLVLVHGYCAATNPWDDYPEDWTNAAFFLNPSANIGTHKFAELVDAWAETNGFSSYSVVGHSQGGMVGAHLHNYFWTGMDVAKENSRLKGVASARLVQSVGTPYQGCSGAGSAANLAKAFGAGCGENYDLTTDGASIWLSGITADSKEEVYYYTTTYKLGTFFGDYCNIAVNMVLEWPNDGTSELVYTKLAGATNMGNTEKQCHTTDMGYMAQYLDRTRNKQMNAAAAR